MAPGVLSPKGTRLETGGRARKEVQAPGRHRTRRPTAGASTPAPVSGSRAERYQVVLHIDAQTLQPHGETGRSTLDDGTRVSAEPSGHLVDSAERTLMTFRETAEHCAGETSRRLCCDAGLSGGRPGL